MSYKTILVHVHTPAAAEATIRFAIDLAKRHEAVLAGVAAGFPRPPMYYDGFSIGPDMIAAERQQIEADLQRAGDLFRRLVGVSGVASSWQSSVEFPLAAVGAAARIADLVIVDRPPPPALGDFRSLPIGDLLLQAGRPVLVLPAGERTSGSRLAVVAWKDTREARRAVSDALPLLSRSTSVVIVEVREHQEGRPTLGDAKVFLERHGVQARTELLPAGDLSAAGQIFDFASRNGADLIVAGAYGHSRLTEWVFGGVTREILSGCSLPCLLSH
jgi:nucleotide-binding universal stress UspA family protein